MSSDRCTCHPSFRDPYPDLCRYCESQPSECETCGSEHGENDECSFTCDGCHQPIEGEPLRTAGDTTLRVCGPCSGKCAECGEPIGREAFSRDWLCDSCSTKWNAPTEQAAEMVASAA